MTEQLTVGLNDSYTDGTILNNSLVNWVETLTPQEFKCLQKAFNEWCLQDPDLTKVLEKIKLQDLDFGAFLYFAYQGAMIKYTKTTTEAEGNPEPNMGSTLVDLFDTISSLETFKQQYSTQYDTNDIRDIIELYNATQGSSQDNELVLDEYRNALDLYDPKNLREWNEHQETIARNLLWVPNFVKYHKKLKASVLFDVGDAHLYGEWGLLSLLLKAGFKIKRLTPNGTFEEYTYPFTSNYVSRKTLFQERYMLGWMRELLWETLPESYHKRNQHNNNDARFPVTPCTQGFLPSYNKRQKTLAALVTITPTTRLIRWTGNI